MAMANMKTIRSSAITPGLHRSIEALLRREKCSMSDLIVFAVKEVVAKSKASGGKPVIITKSGSLTTGGNGSTKPRARRTIKTATASAGTKTKKTATGRRAKAMAGVASKTSGSTKRGSRGVTMSARNVRGAASTTSSKSASKTGGSRRSSKAKSNT